MIVRLKNSIKNSEIKIRVQMYYHFLSTIKKDLKTQLKRERDIYLGDIIININKIKNRKNLSNFKTEFNKLWIHGLTHLFGYDHKKYKDFINMKKIEREFISYLN